MITQTSPQAIAAWPSPLWKRELRDAITDSRELLELLDLADSPLARRTLASSPFPLRVPLPFVARMEKGNPDDPLLRQVLPIADENLTRTGFVDDPLEEGRFNPVPGIVHKYRSRVLLITTPVCAVNCRYCFRRHFPYGENTPGKQQWLSSLNYIRADSAIREVILSGGDPLASDDQRLAWLVEEIEKIPHVTRLRIHTRLPVVIPSRIDDQCLAWLGGRRLKLCVVLHINHANEIDAQLSAAAARIRALDIPVLNQAVLLRGVNDDPQILADLSETLFAAGILPYYLHLLDPVAGGTHFETPLAEAAKIYRELQAIVPGYLLPRLVRDMPGEASKTLVELPA